MNLNEKRNYIKRSIQKILLIILALFALGCGDKEDTENRMYGDVSGFFANEGFVKSGVPVKLLDATSNQFFIACSIMNCEHTSKSEECEARLEDMSVGIYTIIYNEKMYYFQWMYEYVTDVWVKELSGSGHSKVATIPYKYEKSYFILADGKFYFSATEAIVSDEDVEESKPFLVEFDLNTYECRKLTEPEAYEDYSFQKLEVLDGSLYYVYYAYMPDYFKLLREMETMEDYEKAEKLRDCCICKLDLKTLEKTELFTGEDFERYDLKGVSGNYLIFYDAETCSDVKMTSQGEMTTILTPDDKNALDFSFCNMLVGDYIICGKKGEDVRVFISVEDGTIFERTIKEKEPAPFLYNEVLDSVLVYGMGQGDNKYSIMSMEDFISGDF